MAIEVAVYWMFLASMFLFMVKSRFTKMGVDNSGQFEPHYMQKVQEKIASSIKESFASIKACNPPKDPDEFYNEKERMVLVEGVNLKL